jgi:hypothetical protein
MQQGTASLYEHESTTTQYIFSKIAAYFSKILR